MWSWVGQVDIDDSVEDDDLADRVAEIWSQESQIRESKSANKIFKKNGELPRGVARCPITGVFDFFSRNRDGSIGGPLQLAPGTHYPPRNWAPSTRAFGGGALSSGLVSFGQANMRG